MQPEQILLLESTSTAPAPFAGDLIQMRISFRKRMWGGALNRSTSQHIVEPRHEVADVRQRRSRPRMYAAWPACCRLSSTMLTRRTPRVTGGSQRRSTIRSRASGVTDCSIVVVRC